VDISLTARVAHQNHDYSHVPSQRGQRWEGPEGDANRALLEFSQGLFSLEFATHRLVDSALHPNRTAGVARRIRVQLLMRKWTVPLYRVLRVLYRLTIRTKRWVAPTTPATEVRGKEP